MTKRLVVTLAFGLAVVAACSGGGDEEAAPSEVATTSAATTSAPPPRVSTATFCRLAIEDDGPITRAAGVVSDFAANPDPTTLDQDELRELSAELDGLEQRAPEELAPHVAGQVDTIDVLLGAAENPTSGQTIDFQTFRSSGLEIAVQCGG